MTRRRPSSFNQSLAWICDSLRHRGFADSVRYYGRELADLVRDLAPERRRSRYGDIDFDFEHNVDTTWATVSLHTRIREWLSGGQYQPSEPVLFCEMLDSLPPPLDGFTFIDLGSGKGRALLMASRYPFRQIIGVELLEELNAIAVRNIAAYKGERQKCSLIESHAGDARRFEFPADPTVLYLFNPFPRHVWRDVLASLRRSQEITPRQVYVIYHNPVHQDILAGEGWLHEIRKTHQFIVYQATAVR
jgi:SAM-dependent methyltransferase